MADKNNNTGIENSGNRNSGNWNSGNRNSGNWNSGDWNSGNRNSGNWNSGNRNSGNWNSGNRNSGNGNSGNRNSGDWNSGDWNSGNFNSNEPPVRLFNKFADMTNTEFRNKYGYEPIAPLTVEWIDKSDMTDAEKKAHPEYGNTGGYLKTNDYKEAWRKAWDAASETDRGWFLSLPNFDAEIFLDITGIDVRKPKVESLSGKKVSVTMPNGETYSATID